MARPEAEARACYFPAPEEAVAGICEHLAPNPDRPDECQILDPCAGEGLAIKQIADHLGLPYSNVWCVELDQGRAEECRANLPAPHVLGPASFLGTRIRAQSFGLIYCNPPFSHELGGGKREEQGFAERCIRLLSGKQDSVLVMVLPIGAIHGNGQFVNYMDSRCMDIAVYRFPDEHRKYREIAMFCKKRQGILTGDMVSGLGCLHRLGWRYGYYNGDPANFPKLGDVQPRDWKEAQPTFDREEEARMHLIPWTWPPSQFEKSDYSDERELKAAIFGSPLNRHHAERVVVEDKVVPMSISKAHLSMLLASGELDGVVYYFDPKGKEVIGLRHVVRGVTGKHQEYNEGASSVTVDEEDECLRIKNVYSQVIDMHTNAFDRLGNFYKFTESEDTEGSDDKGWARRDHEGREHAEPTGHGVGGYPDDYDFALAAQLARMTVENGCTLAEEAQAQARLSCMRDGRAWEASEWVQWIEEYQSRQQERSEAA